MRLLLIIVGMLASYLSYAQSFDQLIRKADSLYNSYNYAASTTAYSDAFHVHSGTAEHYYNAACSAALAGDKVQAINFLSSSAQKGYHNLKWLLQDPDLKSIHDSQGWEGLLKLIQSNLNEYEKDFNKPLKEELEEIYVRDQTLRQLLGDAEKKFSNESDEMRYLWQLIIREDSLNESQIVQLIDEHGWVGTSEVGGKANTALWLVIQHANVEIQEKYLPLLKESVLNGESQGSHLALLQDRVLMRKNEKQIYGSQIVKDTETGAWKVYPVEDPANVNKRRAEVGLGPIEEYVKRWEINWRENK